MMHSSHWHACLLVTAVTTCFAAEPNSSERLSKIAFGSCIKQDRPVPIFDTIKAERPDLVLFTGDNIYADTDDMSVMRAKYAALAANRRFRELLQLCPVLATWDDHDFGVNDGGADYAKRAESQKAFLDFWNIPADSKRRLQAGIYDAKIYGPAGQRVQIILLDTRFFRSPLRQGERRVGGPYYPDINPDKTILGNVQWDWLEEQLKKPAELRLVVSSIQLVASAAGQECWANLPNERNKFLNLLTKTAADGVIIISGDRHWSELSALDVGVRYPLYDLTCSSFNQIHARGTPTKNQYRIEKTTYHKENYGVMEIDWDSAVPTIDLSVRDIEGTSQIEKRLLLSELMPK